MKLSTTIQNYTVNSICCLYAVLFCYAATSKLLDFQTFKMQLGQSPLLSPFAVWVSVIVPISEFIIALMIMIPRFRLLGLFAAFTLMIMFTSYIYIILNYSAFVPCSCGGILQKMSWSQHLIFNIIFTTLAAIAIIIMPIEKVRVTNL
ncbi:MauE/DoxX family redox-associated membrane protein [Flavobacterium sp. 102]|uniref:MauE/DoxX family redox-associated membrane protein n=1 Tax=Flavobacterium sp. 102 TaxID=2135623 RepID=UPI000EB167A8|nr:MauE/DoxX family redox-associated membrane protein [Flavobacterium sp. 102]RKS03039.1 methylamine utilization protein MauE [Flavobacterium sp. 102]